MFVPLVNLVALLLLTVVPGQKSANPHVDCQLIQSHEEPLFEYLKITSEAASFIFAQ
jgi:hypothetical protein